MADRNGQGIGRIGRLGSVIQVQQSRHHELHLLFLRQPVAYDRRLDGERSVLGNGQPAVAAASKATPRTWPSLSADFAFTE